MNVEALSRIKYFKAKFLISPDIYNGFMNTFNDKNSLHINDSYAKSKGFDEKVMHGNILCGFLSTFVGELLPSKNTIIHKISIDFLKPCYLNDEINLDAEIVETYESVSTCIIDFKFSNTRHIVAKGTLQIGLI